MEHPLTVAQRHQLLRLLQATALSAETATDIHTTARLNPVVIGKLREFGLCASRVHKPAGGSQRTRYWLTMAGHATALAVKSDTGVAR